MKIQVWSDIYCPFCYIGEETLKKALTKYPKAKDITIEFKSFELDPSLHQHENLSMYDYVAKKYQMTSEQVKAQYDAIRKRGAEIGIDFQFDTLKLVKTFDAHRLLQLAKTKQKDAALATIFFKALFTEGKDLSDPDTLMKLSLAAGLDAHEVKETLESQAFSDAVHQDEDEATALGITSVPFFLFDQHLAVSGAQDQATFETAIEQAFGLQKGIQILGQDHTNACGPDGCQLQN